MRRPVGQPQKHCKAAGGADNAWFTTPRYEISRVTGSDRHTSTIVSMKHTTRSVETASTFGVQVQRQVMIPMRDGTKLAADLYLPDAPGKYPVVVERTPYNREDSVFLRTDSARALASRGYIVAIQDVRGRFGSEGIWYPFVDDCWGKNKDGYDTIEWLAAHPRSNGNVGTAGGSYAGQTQMLLAPTRPPHLKCCFIREPASDLAKQWLYRGGAFELAFNW